MNISNEIILNNCLLFGLTSEIVNYESIMGHHINKNIIQMFKDNIALGLLSKINKKTREYFNIPDPVYTLTNNLKDAEYQYIFGNEKTKAYSCCRPYYYFYRDFDKIIDHLMRKTKKILMKSIIR